MNLFCGFENEGYKYVHGIYNVEGVPFETEKKIKRYGVKNDTVAVQFLLYSDEEMLVTVNKDNAFYEAGAINTVRVAVEVPGMPKDCIHAKLIGLVEDDDRQMKADIILEQQSILVGKKQVQSLWIELEIDKDLPIGCYEPNIQVFQKTMFESEKLVEEKSFTVEVLDYKLDDPKNWSFYLDLWQHNCNIARKYDVPLWSEEHFEVLKNYVQSLAALGQKAISVILSEIPWSGQHSAYDRIAPSNLFEYNIVEVRKMANGEWSYNFDYLNKYISLCMSEGIEEEIEVFGLNNIWKLEEAGYGNIIEDFNDAIRIRYYNEATQTFEYIKQVEGLKQYIAALEKNFLEQGWMDKVRILADEPEDLDLFKARVKFITDIAPNFKLKIAINHMEFINEDIPEAVDFSPVLSCIAKEYEEFKNMKEKVKGRLSYYVCCTPKIPNTFISSNLSEARVTPWLACYFDIDGFLRWNYTVWPNDPLNKITYRTGGWAAGDTNFVYPGKLGKPLYTLRYKCLRRGIRDFEIMQAYITKFGRDRLMEIIKDVFLWEDIMELHPDKRRLAEEVFESDYEVYETLMARIIKEMV